MEEEEEMPGTANSEIRYITLELMRLAQKSGRTFDQVAQEFIANTVKLQDMIAGEAEGAPEHKDKGKTGEKGKAWQK